MRGGLLRGDTSRKGLLMKRTHLPVAVALVAMLTMGLAGCAQGVQGVGTPAGQGTPSVTEAPATEGSAADAAADAGQEEAVTVQTESADVYKARMNRACEFVFNWQTTTGYDPDDDTILWPIDEWHDRALAYIAPGSGLYEAFANTEDPNSPGVVRAVEVVKGAWVTEASPYTYTVCAIVSGTQGGDAGWTEQTYECYHTITFDENNQIVRLDNWG